jgi:two-component sensor histidine kinase
MRKVAIIDDVLSSACLLKGFVTRLPDVETALLTDPSEALSWCIEHEPDLVLLDYLMPGMNGIEFLQCMRAVRHLQAVPVIIVTGVESKETLYQALNSGATDFLRKPVDHLELIARARNMLELRARQSQLAKANEQLTAAQEELSHRIKNLMALVQAIAWQTAQQSQDFEDFEHRFTQRLKALARSHALLVKREWHGVVLEDLVRAQLEPFVDRATDRLLVHGPALQLTPLAAQDLGLALHELATNASKYGALSVLTGKLEIGWRIDRGAAGAKQFHLTWRESGGPMVSPPAHNGFGSRVIGGTLPRTFNGKVELAYAPEGFSLELTAPMGDLIAELDPH